MNPEVLGPVAVALIAILLATLAAVTAPIVRSRRAMKRIANRAAQPSQLDLGLLEQPVKLPDGYDDTWTDHPDGTDVQLAIVHDQAWPNEEWYQALLCPHPLLPGYATHAAAKATQPGHEPYKPGEPYECACGLLHVRRPSVRARARRPHRSALKRYR
jgi:hypothetical protein